METIGLEKRWQRQVQRNVPTDPELFGSLMEPTRFAIFEALLQADTPLSVGEVHRRLVGTQLCGVSRHLKHLESTGLVFSKKTGREKYYQPRLDFIAPAIEELYERFVEFVTRKEDA